MTAGDRRLKNNRTPPERLQRAISIRQPYIEQILAGTKKREFRSRSTRIRERVYLYAAMRLAEGADLTPDLAALPKGLIVGSVEIADCRDLGHCYGYVLKNPRRYRYPVRASGQPQPGFWRPRLKW
jgi:predicted transcriptional regulator